MKVINKIDAEESKYASTSTVLDYSMKLDEKNLDFCINKISGRYPEKGYCSNLECEELCYVLEGEGQIVKKDELLKFSKDSIVFIDKKEIYYWEGNFKIAIICTPAWSKNQCKLFDE